jgi:P-type Cu2+ transporter
VHAGTVNLGRVVRITAETTGAETRLGQLVAAVEEAGRRKAPIVSLADRISGIFVAAVMIVATVVFAAWLVADSTQALERTIAVLIVSCPCALGLATPLAIAAALGKAARAGILIKGGDVFERLAKPCTFYFDKTGTLTEGGLRVVSFRGDETVIDRVAGIERWVSHPAAKALVAHSSAPADIAHTAVQEVLGGGVEAQLADGRWRIGSPRFALGEPMAERERARIDEATAQGLTPIVVSRDGVVLAVAGLGDALRGDAAESLAKLRRWGHEVRILSGDHPDAVARIAARLGLGQEAARGGQSPEEKLAVVEGDARAVMVGDGVNDAAALSSASVGIAVHGGAEASLAAADVFATKSGVGPVVELVEGARRVIAVVRRNLVLSLFYNITTVALAATGIIGPLGAAILMPLSSLTVVASSYQARTFEPRKH